MAVKGTLLFEAGQTEYAIPLAYTEAVVSLYKPDIHQIGRGLVATYLGQNHFCRILERPVCPP